MTTERLLLVGYGDVARAVTRASRDRAIFATTRSPEKAAVIAHDGATAIVSAALSASELRDVARGADVLVSFPPDGFTDARIAPAFRDAKSLVYISSTAVFGDARGKIDDSTAVDPSAPRAQPRLDAEATYREIGAVVLRAPGIYGASSGLHLRLRAGSYRVPGDGSGVISRIHEDDLAAFVIAAFSRGKRGETYVVGDLAPVPQREVIAWLCERMGLPYPDSAPLADVSPTLRGSRSVDSSRALRDLGVTLRYPTYREGFAASLDLQGREASPKKPVPLRARPDPCS